MVNYCDTVSSIVNALRYLHLNQLHTDFTILSQERKEFKVHKLILSIHSPYLCDVVQSSSCDTIETDLSNAAIEYMIRHCYGENDIKIADISDIQETKRLADMYQISELSRICRANLTQIEPNVDNVIDVLQTAVEYRNEEKESESLSIMSANIVSVCTKYSFPRTPLENMLQILNKLRDRKLISEASFLRSAFQWMKMNQTLEEKNRILAEIDIHKIPLNKFLKIIVLFPNVFSNKEISNAVAEIVYGTHENLDFDYLLSQEELLDYESDRSILTNSASEMGSLASGGEPELQNSIGPIAKKETSQDKEKEKASRNSKRVTIYLLEKEDGHCSPNWKKRVRIEITDDDSSLKAIQLKVGPELKDGILGRMTDAEYHFTDVNITYDGIYYISLFIDGWNSSITPFQYLEVLKVALFLEASGLINKLVDKILTIEDYDPIFLCSLRDFKGLTRLQNRSLHLLKERTLQIICHPNIISSSPEFMIQLLDLDKLSLVKEGDLLLTVIQWLEARNRSRWEYRSDLLRKIAFNFITEENIKYCCRFHKDFFSDEESKIIFEYKSASEDERHILSPRLPIWYTHKDREFK